MAEALHWCEHVAEHVMVIDLEQHEEFDPSQSRTSMEKTEASDLQSAHSQVCVRALVEVRPHYVHALLKRL